ncbi:MAG TPA: sulfotransferase family 2 domain-containing protein [Acidimicrobiia bacterium]|nr:sulfotransferase family 2 domain-containing protein [Acidimicrobiia bacterium]
MTASSTFWRAVLKWPSLQRLEVLDLPDLEARVVQVPKTGSGTIRMQVLRQLREQRGHDLPKEALWQYVRFVPAEDLPGLAPPRFSFGFARDPYARLVSCYRHKILAERRRGKRLSPLFAVYGRAFSLQMDFPEFVRAVAAVPDERAEKHFRSQTRFLFRDGRPLVDFVGHLERFDEDWAEVCRHTRLQPVARAYNVTGADRPPLEEWYDPELLTLVERRYAEDFALLGYPMRRLP